VQRGDDVTGLVADKRARVGVGGGRLSGVFCKKVPRW
jgi:hypothetical protein